MDNNFVFGKIKYGGGAVDFVFGGGAGGGDGAPSWIEGTTAISNGSTLSCSGLAVYNNRNPARVSTTATSHFDQGSAIELVLASDWQDSVVLGREPTVSWDGSKPLLPDVGLRWVGSVPMVGELLARWDESAPVESVRTFVHETADPVRTFVKAPWSSSEQHSVQAAAPFGSATASHREVVAPWGMPTSFHVTHVSRSSQGLPAALQLLAPWQIGRVPNPGVSTWGEVDPGTLVRVPDFNLVFCRTAYTGGPVNIIFGRTCDVDPIDPGTIVVPIRSVYMTVNSLALVRVSDGAVIPASGFGMELSADGWTWSWSAAVQGKAMGLFAPELGEPVELAATVNGVEFRLMADQVGRTRRFGENALAVSGMGLAMALDDPYSPVKNFSAAADRTAQQLANEALTLNGESIGWAVDWGLEDWLVPGGVWSHQGSYISAINAIAAAAGGYVQPHRTAKTLRVLHRYPVAPWDWADVTPDIILPSAPVIVEGIKWSSKTGYNRVHVSGQGAGGVGEVTRDGTAGDVSAPMVVDQLITAVEAARQCGRAVLSDTGRQALVTLSLPVLSETGLILPGQFLQYVDGADTRRGIVRGSALSWDRPRLRQQLTVETHEIA